MKTFMAVAALFLSSCAANHPQAPVEGAPVHYRVLVDAMFGPTLAGDDVLQGPMDARLEMRLSSNPTRRFRDGSTGRLLRFEAVNLSVDSIPQPLELEGRSVEIRTFPNGEILDIAWMDKVSGHGRYLDVFGVVFSALSPAPPSLKVAEQANRRIIWPYREGKALRWDNAVQAVWTNEGKVENDGNSAWQLQYEGPWTLSGATRYQTPEVQYTARGAGKGTILMDVRERELLRHRFEWHRDVTVMGVEAVSQAQTFRGTVEVMP